MFRGMNWNAVARWRLLELDRALVVQISEARAPDSLALNYAAITRLGRDDHGCYMTIICSAPELGSLVASGHKPDDVGSRTMTWICLVFMTRPPRAHRNCGLSSA